MADNWKKNIIKFLAGQNISLFGSSLVQFTIIWYVTLTTGSGLMMTIGTLCAVIPQIIIGFFSGVWADKFNRKYLIIIADSMIALSTLIIAVLFYFKITNIGLLFIVMGVRAMGAGIQMPAVSALIPQLVPQDKLMKINGINTSMQSVMLLLSPTLGGIMMSIAPLEYSMMIDVVTALIGISLLMTIPVKRVINEHSSGYFKDIVMAIKYVRKNHMIKSIITSYSLFYFLITPLALLTPLLVARNYGPEVWRLTLNEVLFSGGAIFGGLIIAYWGGFKNRLVTMTLGIALMGVMTVALGLKINFTIYLVIIMLLGITMPFIGTPPVVLFQERIEPEIQGRIFGLHNIITVSAFPLGMALFGPLADIISIDTILIITGVLIIIEGIVIILNKKFIKAGVKYDKAK